MPEPTTVTVHGLFGRLEHQIALTDRIRILTGPNGTGKTHMLNLIKSMVGLDLAFAAQMPFNSAEVSYADGSLLTLTNDSERAVVVGTRGTERLGEVVIDRRVQIDEDLPQWLDRVGPDTWYDSRSGKTLTGARARREYDLHLHSRIREVPEADWLTAFRPNAPPILIATGRLDVGPAFLDETAGRYRPGRRREAAARIVEYSERISELVAVAKGESLRRSQAADRLFAGRALDKARATVKEGLVRGRYESISQLHQQLHENGLIGEEVQVGLPGGRTNPTERRVLSVFLDDWQEKLQPLLPVHKRLQLLRDIVGKKFAPKMMSFDERGNLVFLDSSGEPITVDQLSSGEQHLIALFTMLLFAAGTGSLVLIDEPEISLHAAWKHAFLDDIERVAALNDLRVVAATHSTGIINGRWDLVQELSGDSGHAQQIGEDVE